MRKIITGSLVRLVVVSGLTLLAGNGIADEQKNSDGFAALDVIDVGQLHQLRGADGNTNTNVQSIQGLQATVNGSQINAGSMVSGGVVIGERAMDNMSGVALFNIVTGSNNAIDSAVGVTINLQ